MICDDIAHHASPEFSCLFSNFIYVHYGEQFADMSRTYSFKRFQKSIHRFSQENTFNFTRIRLSSMVSRANLTNRLADLISPPSTRHTHTQVNWILPLSYSTCPFPHLPTSFCYPSSTVLAEITVSNATDAWHSFWISDEAFYIFYFSPPFEDNFFRVESCTIVLAYAISPLGSSR